MGLRGDSRGTAAASDQSSLLDVLREDLSRHGGQWHRPGFHAVAVHRVTVWQRRLPFPLRLPVAVACGLLYFVTRNLYGIELPGTTKIGRRLLIGHQSGIVVSQIATIGDDCMIRQNVTIGALGRGARVAPTIGDRVEIGPGAVILGGVRIGDGATIGPNAVVTTDVPAGARVVAPPSRIVPGTFVPSPGRPGESPVVASDSSALRDPILDRVLEVIRQSTGVEPSSPDTPLLSSGLVDSLGVAGLVDALDDSFSVALTIDDLDAATFDTAREIAELVSRRVTR